MMKIAVIGYGGQGAWHCGQLQKSDIAILAGTYDTNEIRMKAAFESGISTYASFEAVLADGTVDAVVVATPNNSHKELAIRALKAGKHVICEKPVEMSVAAFDEMAAVAKETGKILTVHQNRRFDVDFLAMKQIVTGGEIGELINIESRIQGSRGIPSDWRGTKECGGGMILDWGVHLIDQILQIIPDTVTSLYCETTHITNKEVDDGFKLGIYFETGKRAYVEVGTYNFLKLPRFYLQCKDGSALIENWREKTKVNRLTAWCEKDPMPVQNAAGITKTMAPRDEKTIDSYAVDIPVSDVHDFYRNFCDAANGKGDTMVSLREVRRVLQVMEGAFLSCEKHAVIGVTI